MTLGPVSATPSKSIPSDSSKSTGGSAPSSSSFASTQGSMPLSSSSPKFAAAIPAGTTPSASGTSWFAQATVVTTSIVAGTSVVPKAWSMLVASPVPAAPASLPSPPEAPASGEELSEEQAVRAAARARAEPVKARRVKRDIGAFREEVDGGARGTGPGAGQARGPPPPRRALRFASPKESVGGVSAIARTGHPLSRNGHDDRICAGSRGPVAGLAQDARAEAPVRSTPGRARGGGGRNSPDVKPATRRTDAEKAEAARNATRAP